MSEPYTPPEGYHRHRCPECGFVWEHAGRTEGAVCDYLPGQLSRHDCPRPGCQDYQFDRYHGDAPPDATTRSNP